MLADLWGSAGAYIRAVAKGSPLAHVQGLDLAQALFDYLDAIADEATGTGDR